MDLAIPPLLTKLIAAGIWPADGPSAMRQNLHPLVLQEKVRQLAPEEDTIYFNAPPFRTIASELAGASPAVLHGFWERFGALDQIKPELALILGDFGMGSDAPIVLNFASTSFLPSVWRLRLGPGQQNSWVQVSSTFDEFAGILGLPKSVA